MEIYLDWTNFKNIVISKKLFIQFYESLDYYIIWAENNQIIYRTQIIKEASTKNIEGLNLSIEENNQQDFENSYKLSSNKITSSWIRNASYNPLREWQSIGQKYTIIPPSEGEEFKQNIFDFKLDSSICGEDGMIELLEGRYYIKNEDLINENDIIEFSVIDKDDVLGLFSSLGLVVGDDILELKKFIKTHSVVGGRIISFQPGQVKELISGLYLRTTYICYGSVSFLFKVDFVLPS